MASKTSSIATWLKGVTNNTKPSKSYKTTSNKTSASVADAGKRAAADAQINSTKLSTYSGSATLSGKQKVMSDAGKAAYAKTGDTRAGSAAAAFAGAAYDKLQNSTKNFKDTHTKYGTLSPAEFDAAAKNAASHSTSNSNDFIDKLAEGLTKIKDKATKATAEANKTTSKSVSDAVNNITNIINGGGGSGGSGGSGSIGGGSSNPADVAAAQLILGLPVEGQRAALADGQSLAELYGIDYNRDNIEQIFQDATDAEHKANLAEYNRTMRQYYDKLGSTQNSLIDTLRQQRAASIRNGANAGMQNATELSEILGLTQAVSPDALALAQDRNALIEAYNAQRAQNVRDALEYSDQLKQALAALASEKYGYDAQQYVGELSHNANVQAQNTASSAAYTGNKYATLEDILGLAVVPSLTYKNKE